MSSSSSCSPWSPLELPLLNLKDKEKQEKIEAILKPLILTEAQQERFREVFLEEMARGLAAEPDKRSSLLMENTFIPELLNGTESGEYLALDLGGTNFRVIYVIMKDGRIVEEIVDYFHVPQDTRLGPGEQLFDFLAQCISEFIHGKQLAGRNLKLGFTFSFPMTQRSLDSGILVTWTKSFNCPGVVGEDAARMLNQAIAKKKDLDITVNAILNDTTGTLVMGSYLDSRCALGIILGTGSNAAYIEKVERIEKWRGRHTEKEMLVDIEWGGFGDNGVLSFIKTGWDYKVDEDSLLTGSYTFEKYFGGKYLGDLYREVLSTLAGEGCLGEGGEEQTARLATHGAITTTSVSNIEKENFEGQTETARKVMTEMGITRTGHDHDDDLTVMKHVAGIVSYRGVLMVSLLVGILLNRMERSHCTIAIDGSLFKNHPRFKALMEHLIAKFAPGRNFDLRLAMDGSGKGAALISAIADRLHKAT